MNPKPNAIIPKPRSTASIVAIVAFALVACESKTNPPQKKVSAPVAKAAKDIEKRTPTLASTAPTKPKPVIVEAAEVPDPVISAAPDMPMDDAEQPSFDPVITSDGVVEIRRLITAPDIDAREPVAASLLFSHHETIHAFLDVRNESNEEQTLTINYVGPSKQIRGGVKLAIPADVPRWRTWAFTKHAEEPGLWHVEVRDQDGMLLATLPFEVAEGC